MARGEYGGVEGREGGVKMVRGVDENKDESYFLNQVREEEVRKVVFRIGEVEKRRVREIGKEGGVGRGGEEFERWF